MMGILLVMIQQVVSEWSEKYQGRGDQSGIEKMVQGDVTVKYSAFHL